MAYSTFDIETQNILSTSSHSKTSFSRVFISCITLGVFIFATCLMTLRSSVDVASHTSHSMRHLLSEEVDVCVSEQYTCGSHATCFPLSSTEFECRCNSGFSGDGHTCIDINECHVDRGRCGRGSLCINTVGSYQCECPSGFLDRGFGCEDVDECSAGLHSCAGEGGLCRNTEGSYICSCAYGWCGDGSHCQDINECESGLHSCHAHASCINEFGGYACVCNQGYTGTGTACTPTSGEIDECSMGSHHCSSNAVCQDTLSGYTCTCLEGYQGDGFGCSDIDECGAAGEQGVELCDGTSTCVNEAGAYTCQCREGYFFCDCGDLESELELHRGEDMALFPAQTAASSSSDSALWPTDHQYCHPVYVFTQERYYVVEDAGEVVIRVLRRDKRDQMTRVHVWTSPVAVATSSKTAPATPEADFIPLDTYVTFMPGDISQTIRVQIVHDGLMEGDEPFLINLDTASHEIVIVDVDN
eukprot:TRINITY_DN1487_c0_g1::TRINITY_DN1487_c0_g1_i1::g.27160::m.27160 TRINITY_DN1487_c0_g1::TRINITY_DN1487_c0_g1_i1::g.27160  ORF type:complete len:472 (+),score=111.93,sp/P35555/FBN1_HUMAN/40.00/9e-36,sp/P35555/FBN1_HUMAN/35.56/6e-29,sp/P35555/FBN1_HUMAN/39.83/9e-29,sp/P35555/FBN1_HUMAN/30.00/4e-24,sp/P35555/FBN1_HUMAN/36.32/1e-23,sp/P35555/FBN1_HUMAN/36.97/4e-21,sp/P35555/FBN1_HUMAN/33.71/6e-21,sp/P35555/FBN1_HUMAN/35.06/3e-18,sp/P35555/FBN1_HUMAN/39.15/5e-18,sp/P35555/FBN1_HUMAN/41.55/5e-17,sp/P355